MARDRGKRIVSVEMENVLIADIEREMALSGFSTRSEFIKTAVRQYLQVLHDRRVAMGTIEGAEPQISKSEGANVGRT